MAMEVLSKVISVFFEYDTPHIVHIKSKKVGIINRLLQLGIIAYVIGFTIVYKKGYQEFDNVQGAVTTKVKGVAETCNLISNDSGRRIWDVADYVIPAQENNAFFVVTNLIITDGQHLDLCEEDNSIPGANCTDDPNICLKNEPLMAGDGYMTGNCIESQRYPGEKSCEVFAWCPTENGRQQVPDPPALAEAENFTVFIKNNIEFPKFGVKRRNIPDFSNNTYLSSCRFDFNNNNQCPIFKLGTIIGGTNSGSFKDIAMKGGVIQIIIDWDCNLDYDATECVPEYSFRRLDSNQDILSKGYNFRYAQYSMDENGTDTRRLYKAYGIKFIVTMHGRAGKFNPMPLTQNIGSGMALLAIATILCDIVVLYILKAKYLYREKKYLQVVGDDAYQTMSDDGGEDNLKES